MPLRVICPSCGRSGRVPENALGRHAVCPACGTRYKITTSVLASEAFEVASEPPVEEPPSPNAPQAYQAAARSPRSSAPAESEYPDLPRDPWPVRRPAPEPEPERPLWIYGAVAGGGVAAIALLSAVVWLVFLRGGARRPAADAPEAAWVVVAPRDKGFSITMPEEPRFQPRVDRLADGKTLEHHIYVADVAPSSYAVNYVEFPDDVDPAMVAKMFDDARDQGVQARHSKVVEERNVELEGHPGREWVEEVDGAGGGEVIKMRVFVVGRRFYTLVASWPKSVKPAVLDAERFFASFRIQGASPEAEPGPEGRPAETAVVKVMADPPVAKVAGRALKYGWKPSKTYVYSVHVGMDLGRGLIAIDGASVYKVKTADASGITMVHSGWFVTRRHTKDGLPAAGGGVKGPDSTRSVELKINAEGTPLSATGDAQLPLLGDLAMMVIEPLPSGTDDAWEDENELALNEVHIDSSGPPQVARPSLRDRIGRARPKPSSRLRRGARPAAPRAQAKVSTTAHPAHEKSSYALVAESGNTVTIARTYVFKTDETAGDEPLLQMVANGTITFDVAEGVPRSMEFKAIVSGSSPKGPVKMPMDVRCTLLTGDERERAVRPPVFAPTALQPMTEKRIGELVAELKSKDNGRRRQACQVLFNAAPVESSRAAVVRALGAMMEDHDTALRNEAIRALGVWADKSAAKSIIYRLNIRNDGSQAELLEALGRIGPCAETTEAMIAWLGRDPEAATRVLRAEGSAAVEPALLKIVQEGTDLRLRSSACRALRDVGTERSVEVLKSFAQKRGDEEAARAASNAMSRIEERTLTPEKLAKALEVLKSNDNGQRIRTADWLAQVKPAADRRAEVARAVEPMLDVPDVSSVGAASRALAVWGDEQSAAALRKHVELKSFENWRDAAFALAAIAHDDASARAIAVHVEQDRGHVFRLLREMGPGAEKTLIEILKSSADGSTRADAANVLRFVGTKQCIPALEAAAKNRRDGIAAGAAEQALKGIAERAIASETLNTALASLKSGDPNQRRTVLQRLASLEVQEERRTKISRAVEASFRAESDEGLQREALKVLAIWGDHDTAELIGERVKDPSFRPWREAAEALGKMTPGDASAEVIMTRMKDDQGLVERIIREMKPFPEKTMVKILLADPNPGMRRAAAGFLEAYGTTASLPALKPLASQAVPDELGSVAEEAIRGITERL